MKRKSKGPKGPGYTKHKRRRKPNMSTPYIGYGADKLATKPRIKAGDKITCPHCK